MSSAFLAVHRMGRMGSGDIAARCCCAWGGRGSVLKGEQLGFIEWECKKSKPQVRKIAIRNIFPQSGAKKNWNLFFYETVILRGKREDGWEEGGCIPNASSSPTQSNPRIKAENKVNYCPLQLSSRPLQTNPLPDKSHAAVLELMDEAKKELLLQEKKSHYEHKLWLLALDFKFSLFFHSKAGETAVWAWRPESDFLFLGFWVEATPPLKKRQFFIRNWLIAAAAAAPLVLEVVFVISSCGQLVKIDKFSFFPFFFSKIEKKLTFERRRPWK